MLTLQCITPQNCQTHFTKFCTICCKIFKVCLTILGRSALKGYNYFLSRLVICIAVIYQSFLDLCDAFWYCRLLFLCFKYFGTEFSVWNFMHVQKHANEYEHEWQRNKKGTLTHLFIISPLNPSGRGQNLW